MEIPKHEEIENLIEKLKNNKAPGEAVQWQNY